MVPFESNDDCIFDQLSSFTAILVWMSRANTRSSSCLNSTVNSFVWFHATPTVRLPDTAARLPAKRTRVMGCESSMAP
jgi:hypothetical protein